MKDPDALLGIVEPELPDMPPVPNLEQSAYSEAQEYVVTALSKTQERLRDLRKQREEINAEIKHLVDEEELLERMSRIRRKS